MAILAHVATLVLLLPSVLGSRNNNWNTPCFGGKCAYDVSHSTSRGLASGSLMLSGSSSAISDITPAAGWTIINCDAESTAQTIRAICTGSSSDCAHLYEGGAVGTIVRLPDSCGKMPFARVVKEWSHQDQSVPSSVAAKISRRSGSRPTVRGITVDTNFAAVDASDKGNVTLFLQGATGSPGNFTVTPPVDALAKRGWWSDLINAVLEAMSFDIHESDTKSFSYDKSHTLLDSSISCPAVGAIPAFTGEFRVGVEAKADLQVAYGVAAVGTIVPPEIADFGVFVNLDAQLDGILTVDANANANIGSGTIPIYTLGLPGFDFAGILTLGASFAVTAEADASVSADANVNVDLSYAISGAKLFFPPGKGSNQGVFTAPSTHLLLTANPVGTASGTVNAHLTPVIELNLDAFAGVASAGVSLTVDGSADVNLSLNGNGVVSTGGTPTASYSGCVDVGAGLDVNFQADANFFGLWNPSKALTLFDRDWDLFDRCFSGSTKKRDLRQHSRDIQKRGLSCPAPRTDASATVVSTAIPSASARVV